MTDKVVVTNVSALREKYGPKGLATIRAAVDDLIAADAKRGLSTRMVALDGAATMKKLKAPRVTVATDPAQNKKAIDGLYRALVPDYLLLLGAIDVVPHQDVRNPVYDRDDDPDRFAYSDVPYACEAPYSRRPQDFIGPTRVVARLPDVTGAGGPQYLAGLLKTAATWKASPKKAYEKGLGISAQVWRGSTKLSLDALFGASDELQLSPAKGPKWTAGLLSRRSHFINCHGSPADPRFYGQRGESYPISHDAAYLAGRITEGTVVAAECCYGAELYDPKLHPAGQAGIGNTYLVGKAYGYFGSSTIAYGPENENSSADLLCQFFLKHVLAGASLGRAALEARQEFAQSSPELDPIDLKTLFQFNLLGDPSIQPVAGPAPHAGPAANRGLRAMASMKTPTVGAAERMSRRRQLFAKGMSVARNQAVARRSARPAAAPAVRAALATMTRSLKLASSKVLSFDVTPGVDARRAPVMRSLMAKKRAAPTRIHVVFGRKATSVAPSKAAHGRATIVPVVAIVAKEVAGQIVAVRELHRR